MLVTITAALLLIQPFGVLGAAWTTLVGSAVSAILRTGLLMKLLGQTQQPVGALND